MSRCAHAHTHIHARTDTHMRTHTHTHTHTGTCSALDVASDPDLDDDIEVKEYSGEIEIPNLSEEHEADEIDVIVTAKKNTKESRKLKELVHRVAPGMIRGQLSNYLKSLREGIVIKYLPLIINDKLLLLSSEHFL